MGRLEWLPGDSPMRRDKSLAGERTQHGERGRSQPPLFLEKKQEAGWGKGQAGHLQVRVESGFPLQQKGARSICSKPLADYLLFILLLVDRICCLLEKA